MWSNKKWFAFFHNISINQHLLTLFVTSLYADDFVHSSPLPVLVKNKNEIFKISSSVIKVFECNYEEADTRMIFHVFQQKPDVAVCSKDTDVLVLMVFVYALSKANEK